MKNNRISFCMHGKKKCLPVRDVRCGAHGGNVSYGIPQDCRLNPTNKSVVCPSKKGIKSDQTLAPWRPSDPRGIHHDFLHNKQFVPRRWAYLHIWKPRDLVWPKIDFQLNLRNNAYNTISHIHLSDFSWKRIQEIVSKARASSVIHWTWLGRSLHIGVTHSNRESKVDKKGHVISKVVCESTVRTTCEVIFVNSKKKPCGYNMSGVLSSNFCFGVKKMYWKKFSEFSFTFTISTLTFVSSSWVVMSLVDPSFATYNF